MRSGGEERLRKENSSTCKGPEAAKKVCQRAGEQLGCLQNLGNERKQTQDNTKGPKDILRPLQFFLKVTAYP